MKLTTITGTVALTAASVLGKEMKVNKVKAASELCTGLCSG